MKRAKKQAGKQARNVKQSPYARRAVKGFAIIFIVNILAAFMSYLLRIVMARNLTTAEYGLFFSIQVLINFLAVFKTLGLDQALVKYIPYFQVRKKFSELNTMLSTALIAEFFLALTIAVALFLASGFLATNYFRTPIAAVLLKIFAVIYLISVSKDFFRSVFQGYQKPVPFSLNYFAENSIILALVLMFFYYGFGLLGVVLAHLFVFVINFLIFLPFYMKCAKASFFKIDFSYPLLKKLLRFGIPAMLGGVGNIVVVYLDTLFLTYYRPLSEVGIYNGVVPTALLLNFIAISLVQVIFPLVSELWAMKKKKELKMGIQFIQKYLLIITLPLTLILFCFSGPILRFLFGAEYVQGATTLKILVFAVLALIFGAINLNIISAIGKPKLATKIMLLAAGVNFAINFIFIPWLGMLGAAITSLIAYVIVFLVSQFYLSKSTGVIIRFAEWLKIMISGVIFAIAIYILTQALALSVLAEVIISVLGAGAIYIALIFLLKIMNFNEIKSIVSMAKGK